MVSAQIWQIEVRHSGLNKYRLIRGTDKFVVEQKAAALRAEWDRMWQVQAERERVRCTRQLAAFDKQQKKELAIQKTNEAKEALANINNTLKHTLYVNDAINWESLKDYRKFNKQKPQLCVPSPPNPNNEPKRTDARYTPKVGILDRIIKSRRLRQIQQAHDLFEGDRSCWKELNERYAEELKKSEEQFKIALEAWEKEEKEFIAKQQETNDAIQRRKEEYFAGSGGAVTDYCEMVLSLSKYPDFINKDFDLEYTPETKMLVVEYSLPFIDSLPRVKEVKYVQSRDEFSEVAVSQSEFNETYDRLLYQMALRTTHELYEADEIIAIDSVVFNGWVKSIDKATGKDVTACVLSLQTGRSEFTPINLLNVDPKTCFRALKGVGSSKLHSLTPIPPILTINREDKRFIPSYNVADGLDERSNLAAMDWEDFEHLIRELFEKEFASTGGEVKVTQASRDGGVDAVAFDPDPIRGGKIVIQAKRYTNAVGVSAVRDLYGTLMNEGATKGILVTTATFGPDAYEFAKGKPITLLNGSNLLHLLEKHGHTAKIDLEEARKLILEKDAVRQ